MRSIPSNAAPAATKGTAPRYGQLRQPLPARAHPPPRRRHPSRLRLPHPARIAPPDPQAAAVLGRRFWELLAEANRQQVDLTVALTETLARLNTARGR